MIIIASEQTLPHLSLEGAVNYSHASLEGAVFTLQVRSHTKKKSRHIVLLTDFFNLDFFSRLVLFHYNE